MSVKQHDPKAKETTKPSKRGTAPLRPRLQESEDSHFSGHVYLGSYVRTPRSSFDAHALSYSSTVSGKPSLSRTQLQPLLPDHDGHLNLDNYGVEELRDGFFDAAFYRPLDRNVSDLQRRGSKSLPSAFSKSHPLSIRQFFPRNLRAARNVLIKVNTSRDGIKLFKAFLAFFICYIICLIPACYRWLGSYNYIMPVSAIVNHAGRPLGSQIDGLVMTTIGTVAGLGWGSLALYVSTSTASAQTGYGGILATFLVVFAATISWLRAVFLRLYQAVICAGFAIFYMCLADISETVSWAKVFKYGVPWILGQAVCLLVASCVFPDLGSGALA